MKPIVSVILSVKSEELLLEQTFSSILTQSFTDFEFIVIIDGGNCSVDILARKFDDSRVKVSNRPWQGLTKSLNYGLDIAKGKYIARIDAGDYSFPDRLSKQVLFLDNNTSVGLVGTCYIEETFEGTCSTEIIFSTDTKILKKKLMYQNQFCHGTVMFTKQCMQDVGNYRIGFEKAQDYDLWLRISEKYEIANLPDILYKRRMDKNSISIANKSDQELYAQVAVECALSRRRGEIEPLYMLENIKSRQKKTVFGSNRKAQSQYFFNLGRHLFKKRQINKSRLLFLKSIYYWPILLHRWLFLFATLLPVRLVNIIEPLWKKLQKMLGIRI